MHSVYMNLILQAIEALICFNFYESINNTDRKLINAVTIQVGYLIMAGINILFNYNVIINTAVLLIFQLLFARILYKMKAVFSLLYSLLFTVGVTITEISVINVLAVMFDTDSKAFISNPYSYIVLIVASKSLLFVLLRVVVAVVRKTDYKEAIKWHLLIYPASLLLVLTVFVIISYEVNLDDSFKILIAVSSLVLIVSVVFTSIYQQKTSEKEAELIELRTIQSERQINNTYYELLAHQNDQLQMFVHDTKKHYHNLYSMAGDNKEIKNYINSIVDDIDNTNNIGKTSNKLLDLIINKYIFVCRKNELTFERQINYSNFDFIDRNDLTALFNNLLDNAVESATKSTQRKVKFEIGKINSMIVVDLSNSCDKEPNVDKNRLVSSKADKSVHGYGFKSITRSVKKYGGDIEFSYDPNEKMFNISIIFMTKNDN